MSVSAALKDKERKRRDVLRSDLFLWATAKREKIDSSGTGYSSVRCSPITLAGLRHSAERADELIDATHPAKVYVERLVFRILQMECHALTNTLNQLSCEYGQPDEDEKEKELVQRIKDAEELYRSEVERFEEELAEGLA
jgi:hypothetical protein